MADITFEQVRQKYPQYKDLSDDQLAEGLHKKYYPDMPFDKFSAKIGYKTKAEPETEKVSSYDPMGTFTGYSEAAPKMPDTPMPYSEQISKAASTAGQMLAAGGRGVVKGVLSTPGELEYLGAYKLPELLGAKKTPEEQQIQIFPRSETIGKMIEALGGGTTSKAFKGIETVGELIGGLKNYGGRPSEIISPLATPASKIIGATKSTVENALGRGVTKAEEAALSKANEVAAGRLKELTTEESNLVDKIQQEANRIEAAKSATEKAQAAEKSSIGGLKGTKTEKSFGAFETVPATKQETGNYLRNIYENFVNSVRKVRSSKANEEIAAARDAAAAKEASGLTLDSSKSMQELRNFIDERLSETTDKSIADELEKIKKALFVGRFEGNKIVAKPSFASSEDIRRLLGDAAFGVPAKEGYAAISQNLAKDLYGKLSNAMRSYEPSFGSYLDRYKKLSETLETTGTKLGKALGATERDAASYYITDAAALPDRAFKSGESVKTLIDALGGNKEPVISAAERWFAQKAYDIGDLEKVRKFLKSNQIREIASELGPEFEKRITDKYLTSATAQSSRAKKLQDTITASEAVINDANKRLKDLGGSKQTIEEGIKNIENALNEKDKQTAISNLVTKLQGEVPSGKTKELDVLIQGIKDSIEKRKQARWLSAKVLSPLGVGGAFELYQKTRGQ